MVYGSDVMISVEIDSPTWCRVYFDEYTNKKGLKGDVDLVDEIRAMVQIREVVAKQHMARRFDSK